MKIAEWDQRYRERAPADIESSPTPLVERFALTLEPGDVLDVACGAGRNALYLAGLGWRVTAMDGSAEAIRVLRSRAEQRSLRVSSYVTDLKKQELAIQPEAWDLILVCYYLQRNLIPTIRAGVHPGGVVVMIVHITEGSQEPSPNRASPGELNSYFSDWDILHYYEGSPSDTSHKRPVAEIVARRPSE